MAHERAVELNRAAFNGIGDEYDGRESTQLLSRVIPEFMFSFQPKVSPYHGRLLDFACGTGIVTEKFQDHFDSVTGIDINQTFLDMFNRRVNGQSYLLDILEPQDLTFLGKFNMIMCTIAYHHFEDYEAITRKLVTLLDTDGYLVIVDFYNPDVEHVTSALGNSAVRHMGGLKKSALTQTLTKAGLSEVSISTMDNIELWQAALFIENHCTQHIIDKMTTHQLPSKTTTSGVLYLIPSDLIMATAKSN